ncbi:MAG: nucleotide exchange factor GrpE [Deltaproteobacteria bacterium]|nr:nucleotide exchange factor GrpE [Deltaproteobacteria bacterium]
MLAEFVSFKNKIQIQNREQSKNIRCLKGFNEFALQGQAMISLLEEKINKLNTMEEKIIDNAQEKAISAFLDVRDSLVRGVEAGEKISFPYFVFNRKKQDSIIKGYEVVLKKFDLALAMLDTFPIGTNNIEFNPEMMIAVDTQNISTLKKGIVIDEICGGFKRKGKVIRPARVIVNR